MINPSIVFDLLCMMGSECGWGLGENTNFQFSQRALKLSFKQKEQLDAKFVETCVDFEVTHLSIPLVWRSLYRNVLP